VTVLIFSFEQSLLDSLWTIRDYWKEIFWLFKLITVLVTDNYKAPRGLSKEICAVDFDCKKMVTAKTWI